METSDKVSAAEVDQRIAQFEATARDQGVRLTPQRLAIFREVASSIEHPDAEVVYRTVQARLPTVSLDTVYRTLWMLCDLGLISTLGASRGSVRFDANPNRHHHFVCVRCGLTRDFDSAKLHALRLPEAVNALGSVLSTHVEVRGVCEGCARKNDKRPSTRERRPRGRKGHGHERR